MIKRGTTPALGDVLEAYDQLDETGRRVFACAFLHVWAQHAGQIAGEGTAGAGGHWRNWGDEVLNLPPCTGFGTALELPLPGLFQS
jgi:hypothetical protein